MKVVGGLTAALLVSVISAGCTSGSGRANTPTPSPSATVQSVQTIVIKFGNRPSSLTREVLKISSLSTLPGVQDCHFWISGLASQGGQGFELDLAVLAEQANSTVAQLQAKYPEISIGIAGPGLKPQTSLPPRKAGLVPWDAGPMTCTGTSYAS